MSNSKIQFTADGFKKLQEELEDLTKVKKPAAVIRLGKARAMGDLSENSEYVAAKEDLAFAEGRVREIEEIMRRAEVIDVQTGSGIVIGVDVTVERDGTPETYSIVGEFEADPMQKKLSSTSPIGKALMGKKVGDIVNVEVPAGTIHYKIIQIHK